MPKSKARQFMENLCGPLTFGSLLGVIRAGEEQTREQFAHRLGISDNLMAYMESEQVVPSPEFAAELARTLGYSEEQFVELAAKPFGGEE